MNLRSKTSLLTAGLASLLLASAATLALAQAASQPATKPGPTIKETYKGHFLIGNAADLPNGFSQLELTLAKDNYDVITPENCMKPQPVHPAEGGGSDIVASHSLIPQALHHAFSTFGALMSPDLPLQRRHHEMIATMVSVTNRCVY